MGAGKNKKKKREENYKGKMEKINNEASMKITEVKS